MNALSPFTLDNHNLDAVNGGMLPLLFLAGVAAGAGVGYLIDSAFGR